MPSPLDQAIAQITAMFTAPGAPLETVPYRLPVGVEVPMFKQAPATVSDFIAHYCTTHGETVFLVDGEYRLTFGETLALARDMAGGLVAGHGVRPGDRVGIAARNSAAWVVAYCAILMAGGVATLVNGFWNGGEMAEAIRMVGCRFVIADEKRGQRLDGQDLAGAEVLPLLNRVHPRDGLAALLAGGGGADTPLPAVTADDPATILFTSGSTGQSKGAWSNHRSVVQGVFNYVAQSMIGLALLAQKGQASGNQPSTLMNVPLFHVTGEIPIFLQSFAIGRKLVMMERWDAEDAMRLMEAEKVTYFTGVPLMSIEIATHPSRSKYDLSTCISMAAGGAPRPADHVRKIKDSMGEQGFPLLGYGLTETNAVGCGNFNENYLAKPTSTGPASRPIVEIAILDDAGAQLPQGAVGEVCIRSVAVFQGYWDNEAATRDAFTADGWFRTGDLGYLDEDAYLFIVDRKKDIIIRGGENISTHEVEAAAYMHDDVAELCVFGVSDERYGEVPAMVYLPKDGKTIDADAYRSFLAERLAPFKVPNYIWRADGELPRLGTQKIDKRTVKARYAEQAG